MEGRLSCPNCGQEPRPIGSDQWREWWRSHWGQCRGVTLDSASLHNLDVAVFNPGECSMCERVGEFLARETPNGPLRLYCAGCADARNVSADIYGPGVRF